MSARTRTRTVTVDLDATARHCRNHYAKRKAAGDRQVTVWMTQETQRKLTELQQAAPGTTLFPGTVENVIAQALSDLHHIFC